VRKNSGTTFHFPAQNQPSSLPYPPVFSCKHSLPSRGLAVMHTYAYAPTVMPP
jgi:hypothetical protein